MEETIEIHPRKWWYWPDRISGMILFALWWFLWDFISKKIIWPFLTWIGQGIKKTVENLWQSFVQALANAIGKVIGYAVALFVVFAFALLWQANGYSLSKTFSVEGIKTLWETVK